MTETAPKYTEAEVYVGDTVITVYPFTDYDDVAEGNVWTIQQLPDRRRVATNPVHGTSNEWANTRALGMHIAVAFYGIDPTRVNVHRED